MMTRYTESVRARIDLGHRIREERRRLGWSQGKLGERAGGLPRHVIVAVETGSRKVEAAELLAIAAALGTSMQALLGASELPMLPAWWVKLDGRQREIVRTFGEFLLWDAGRPGGGVTADW